jgi:hypothetical protein
MLKLFPQHPSVANTTKIEALCRLSYGSNPNQFFEYAKIVAAGLSLLKTEQWSRFCLPAHQGGIDPGLQA